MTPAFVRAVAGWQPVWGLIWALSLLGIRIAAPHNIDPGEGAAIVRVLGLAGLVSGVAFGLFVALAEKPASIAAMPVPRAVVWGAISAAVFPLLAGKIGQSIPFAIAGAVAAIALVAIARTLTARARPTASRP